MMQPPALPQSYPTISLPPTPWQITFLNVSQDTASIPEPGHVAAMQTEDDTMRSYFKAVAIIIGLLSTYIALLPVFA